MFETFSEFFLREGREKIDLVLFDVDGTLSCGGIPLPGTKKTIEMLKQENVPFLLLTNDCCSSHRQKAEALIKAGIPVSGDNVFSCGDVLKLWAKKNNYNGELFFVCGLLGDPCYAKAAGMRTISDPALIDKCSGVIFGEGQYDWYYHLNAVFNFFLKNPHAPFLVLNPDSYWPSLYFKGLGLGTGAQARFIQSALHDAGKDTQIEYLGKPYPLLYESLKVELYERFGKEIPFSRVAMVGDSLASDIRGAKANGLLAYLVLSGITTSELAAAAPADRKPDMIFSGV